MNHDSGKLFWLTLGWYYSLFVGRHERRKNLIFPEGCTRCFHHVVGMFQVQTRVC